MAWEKKVIWSEGMMLQPHHFQQQSRYHESQLRYSSSLCRPHFWGMSSIEIDKSHLKNGKFCLNAAEGILPDGSYFNFPSIDSLPMAIDINENLLNTTIYLAVSIRRNGNTETSRDSAIRSRYSIAEHEARDVSGTSSTKQIVEVSGLSFSLRTDKDDNNEFSCIPIAFVNDVSASNNVSLQENYIAPSLNIKSNAFISGFLSELVKLVKHRTSALASRVSVAGKATTTEVTDFLMLQTLNRHAPILNNLDQAEILAPFELYERFIGLIGDMSTFIKADKLVPELPIYQHNKLTEMFSSLIEELRQIFSVVLEQNSLNIPLQEKQYGISIGVIADKTLFSSASFILAVTADISTEELRTYFQAQVKIGAIEQIKELVNVQLPGIQLNNLAVAPREIPYQRNYIYYELIQNGEYWNALAESGGIALHVGTKFPNLNMELWAIRSK
ncbi:type VI secretion system baseplate subunit TssK [Glaciecola sp. 33A]|jgi:type VI secretion system protein ImpJ|uniref:type VI secretion system baseplate subunit TssK n=1 Tax=Glaciecola sp. 33A TaxID=2057807 RepID=UPI000C31C2B0|nr:type VI secretion system baseplate subunit TssK [Glaciecola sp. 33A]PKI02971.1 type VI secretion system baseplate subunit TssK [Glaciecola sp. 33A]